MIPAKTLRNIATRTEADIDHVLALVQSMIIDSAVDGKLKRTVSFNTCAFKDKDKSNLETLAYDVAKILTDSGYNVKVRIFKEKIDMYINFYISWEEV